MVGEVRDPTQGTVHLNGRNLQFNSDWSLVDASTIELLGASCQELLDSNTVDVTAEFSCSGFVVVE